MNAIIPFKSIRKKENNKRKIERNKNTNQREQLNIWLEDNSDTSSDYNPNFIDFPNNETPLFDKRKVREINEKKINEKASLIKGENLSLSKKKLIVLNEKNSSSDNDNDRIIDDSDSNYDDVSTFFSSYSFIDQSDEKTKYWIKYKLYDNIMDYSNKKIKLPKLVQLDEEKYCYFYLNNFNTYFYTKSAFLGSNKSINNDKYDLDECKLNESLGLFFCGKNIEYNNENIICSPNSIICKKCMEKNKRRYNLKNKYLININGRVAKKTKGEDKVFHCFGHFLIGKIQIENCLDKFCCEACKLLSKYEKYYFHEK
jgi:hypothetical protein